MKNLYSQFFCAQTFFEAKLTLQKSRSPIKEPDDKSVSMINQVSKSTQFISIDDELDVTV